jgi:hypothetical protein
MEFNWAKREQYPSFLEVELSFAKVSTQPLKRTHISRFPWEIEVGRVTFDTIESKIR